MNIIFKTNQRKQSEVIESVQHWILTNELLIRETNREDSLDKETLKTIENC